MADEMAGDELDESIQEKERELADERLQLARRDRGRAVLAIKDLLENRQAQSQIHFLRTSSGTEFGHGTNGANFRFTIEFWAHGSDDWEQRLREAHHAVERAHRHWSPPEISE